MAYLAILSRIQVIENRLRVLEQGCAQLQADPKVQKLQAALAAANSGLAQNMAAQTELHHSQRQLELDLKSCESHLKTTDDKLYNGQTTSTRELEQLQQKAAEYKEQKTQLEEQLLQCLIQEEGLTSTRSGMQQTAALAEQDLAAAQGELKLRLKELELEIRDLRQELETLLPQLPPEWLKRYQRIAQAHNGIGISQVQGDNCGACHVNLADSIMQKVKRGEDQLCFCENCGRILYY